MYLIQLARIIEIGYKNYWVLLFPDRPMKGGDNLDSWKRGNLRKGGYDPPYKLWLYYGLLWLSYDVTKVGVRLMQMRVLSAFFSCVWDF